MDNYPKACSSVEKTREVDNAIRLLFLEVENVETGISKLMPSIERTCLQNVPPNEMEKDGIVTNCGLAGEINDATKRIRTISEALRSWASRIQI